MFNLEFLLWSSLMGTTLRAAPSKNYAFSTNHHACIAMPTWRRCTPHVVFWHWPPYNLLPRSCITLFSSSILTDGYHFACSAQQKLCLFNKWSCMHCTTGRRCAPPILLWPWSPYNLLPRSCLTLNFFFDSYWWVLLCVQRPAKAIHFQQIIMHALQCQHGVDVHLLFCFDLDLNITSSRGCV